MHEKEKLTQKSLKEILEYNPNTGIFIWKISPNYTNIRIGDIAGGLHHRGYHYIKIKGKKYPSHRLAWLYTYGAFPCEVIDHINGVKDDNRIINLRGCTQKENIRNQGLRTSNTSGFKGVSWLAARGKYVAQIGINNKNIYLGLFLTAEEASWAYIEKAKEIHEEFHRDLSLNEKE